MMTLDDKIAFCLAEGNALKGAKVYYREDWDCYYFDIAGKYFGLLSRKGDDQARITLKNLPDFNQELRDTYVSIGPGYYTNKIHWNSIDLTSDEVSEAMLSELIKTSYQLIVTKLPKKVQMSL